MNNKPKFLLVIVIVKCTDSIGKNQTFKNSSVSKLVYYFIIRITYLKNSKV